MSDIKNTLSSLIDASAQIIVNCNNAESLLLATKASSTLLNTSNQSFESINQYIDTINTRIFTNESIIDCIESLFSLYEKIINESIAIIDIYMIVKSLKGLMENIFDSIILLDSDQSMDQIAILIEKSNKIIDSMLTKINALSDKIIDSQNGYFASKLVSDVKEIQNKAADTQLHFQSIEQLNSKLDSSISDTNNAISTLSSTINSISTRLTDTHTLLNALINNKANPHEVTKEQVGLEHALNAYKSDDVETNDTNSVHSAKATHQIWEKAKSDIGDCPNDGKYYVRQNGKWVEGVVTDSVPVGTVMGYSGVSAPKGYLVLESNTIHSRSLYPALYDHLKFHCPDLIIDSLSFRLCSGEGMFLRGLDLEGGVDPDGGEREILSTQGDAIRNITGEISIRAADNASMSTKFSSGALYSNGDTKGVIPSDTKFPSSDSGWGVGFDASRVVPTSTENRPKNLNVLWIIKAFDCVNEPSVIEATDVVKQVSDNTVEIQKLEPMIKEISNPNLLINGDFNIWQRGDYFDSNQSIYTADRWLMATDSSKKTVVHKVITKYVFNLDNSNHYGNNISRLYELNKAMGFLPTNFMSFQVNEGRGQFHSIIQRIENGYINYADCTLTFSGYFAALNSSKILLAVRTITLDNTGTRNVTSVNSYLLADNPTVKGDRYYTTFSIPKYSYTGSNDDNGNYLEIELYINESVGWHDIACLKLEKSNKATPFIPDDPATNLMKCQRYFIKLVSSNIYGSTAQLVNGPHNKGVLRIEFPTTMRVPPTISVSNPSTTVYASISMRNDYFQINNIDSTATNSGAHITGYVADAEL